MSLFKSPEEVPYYQEYQKDARVHFNISESPPSETPRTTMTAELDQLEHRRYSDFQHAKKIDRLP